MTYFEENKALVDVVLNNGPIDIRFAPFPGTAIHLKKNAEFLPPPPCTYLINYFFKSAVKYQAPA